MINLLIKKIITIEPFAKFVFILILLNFAVPSPIRGEVTVKAETSTSKNPFLTQKVISSVFPKAEETMVKAATKINIEEEKKKIPDIKIVSIFSNKERSSAYISVDKAEPRLFYVGDMLGDEVIKDIKLHTIILLSKDKKREIEF